jgi:hypothetical protein
LNIFSDSLETYNFIIKNKENLKGLLEDDEEGNLDLFEIIENLARLDKGFK